MSWRLRKTFAFEASHYLPLHDGQCRNLHGHSYGLTVEVAGTSLHASGPQSGMVLDYGDITAAVRPLLRTYLDHHDLNTSLPLASPTAEAIAQWIYEQLRDVLPGLAAVEVAETSHSGCRYEP